MKNKSFKPVAVVCIVFLATFMYACGSKDPEADAYGNFESDEVIVSAQAQGNLVRFSISEGNQLTSGELAGMIDSSVPSIKKQQLEAQYGVIYAKMLNIDAQLEIQDEQRINLEREVERTGKLLQDKAATQQQYDDITGKLNVLESQTAAIRTQKNIIAGEKSVLKAQLMETENLLEKCRIVSPISGTVLEKYVNEGELVIPGKALFKIADISNMTLKVYISGNQLPEVAIGDSVTVLIDDINRSLQRLKGVVTWISSQVEFTPKIIQTRAERVNMVYGVKIRVPNDGRLKIGMPGEVVFDRKRQADSKK